MREREREKRGGREGGMLVRCLGTEDATIHDHLIYSDLSCIRKVVRFFSGIEAEHRTAMALSDMSICPLRFTTCFKPNDATVSPFFLWSSTRACKHLHVCVHITCLEQLIHWPSCAMLHCLWSL